MTDSLEGALPGLRERKRRDTKVQILSRAIATFRKLGIRAAHLGEIARGSGVSEATLYNYFPNKGALAEGWVRGEIDQTLEAVSRDLETQGLRRAMRTLCRELATRATAGEDRAVRLEAWRESGRSRPDGFGPGHRLVLALERWQESERVRRDVEASAIASILMETLEGGLIDALRRDLDADDLTKALRTRVDLILDGARKRNERVAAPVSVWATRPVQNR